MAVKTSANIAKKWASQMQQSTAQMQSGVQAVTANPMDAAAAAQDRYAQGTQKAASSGKYAAGCRSVSLAAWQAAYVKKGIPRVADGAAQAVPLVQVFHDQHQPVAQASSDAAKAAKAAGVDGKTRMLANYDAMKAFRFQRPQR